MYTLLVHFGYVLILAALVTRDILWLRLMLVLAQSVIALYAWIIGVPAMMAWNLLFVGINVYWVARILRERRAVTLPEHLRPLYERHFFALSPAEFLRWWRKGRRDTLRDERMTTDGTFPEWLYFILDGAARVSRDGEHVTDVTSGQFVAEMSLLTGEPANADVFAAGTIEVMRWRVDDLKALRGADPAMWVRIQSAIGHDLVVKIQRAEPHVPHGAPGAVLAAAV